ncbi:hypothetical protein [Bradyrhizobium sp. Ai1a-2]|uniref:hypothetical protein n=1 Tax=Bradyrhizobium sp. Ai1a-2 TaxID=196490 RepID=UPI0003FD1791|nr:hypothetical protein [Bradyrhizobium sp. Ai1a-2]
MADREKSPAYAALSPGARRVLAAIEQAIGGGSCAAVSYTGFHRDHGIWRKSVSPAIKALDNLGLIDVAPGLRLANVYRLSDRWRGIDADAARRLALPTVSRASPIDLL